VLPGQVEPPAPPPQIFTDGQGRFLFRGLTKGSYTIGVRASGFLNGSYGQRRVNGPQSQLQLDEDERKTDVTIKLWRYASISGSVRDETGDPAVGVQVTLVRLTTTNGRRSMSQNQGVTTDDRGMYRLGNLTPGTYTVMIRSTMTSVPLSTVDELQKALSNAEDRQTRQKTMQDLSMAGIGVGGPGVQVGDQQLQFQGMNSRSLASPMPGADGRMSVYPTTFYANAVASSQATTFTVASGEERSGIDLQLRLSPAFRVSGTVLGPDGPMGNFPIKLVPGGNEDFTTDSGFETSVTTTDPFGQLHAHRRADGSVHVDRPPRASAGSASAATSSAAGREGRRAIRGETAGTASDADRSDLLGADAGLCRRQRRPGRQRRARGRSASARPRRLSGLVAQTGSRAAAADDDQSQSGRWPLRERRLLAEPSHG
jgi:hypothetical protein